MAKFFPSLIRHNGNVYNILKSGLSTVCQKSHLGFRVKHSSLTPTYIKSCDRTVLSDAPHVRLSLFRRSYVLSSSLRKENSKTSSQSESTLHKIKITGVKPSDTLSSSTTDDSLETNKEGAVSPAKDSQEQSLSIFQRFKNAYKEYGKALIGVHVVTSIVWFGGFYYVAVMGIDVVPLLQKLGFGQTIISKFTGSQVGSLAVAYLLYEIAKPVRYFVTLAGTRQTIVYLRKRGYMEPVPEENRIRQLYKEGRDQLKEKRTELQDKLKEDKITLIYQERKEQFREKRSEWTDKMKEMGTRKKEK